AEEESPQIALNQYISSRPDRNLFPKPGKKLNGLVKELCEYVMGLSDNEFVANPVGGPAFHHALTVQSDGQKYTDRVGQFISDSVKEKLNGKVCYREYKFDKVILLLHNRFDWNSKEFRDIFHPFWHEQHRIKIIEEIRDLLKPDLYDAVYFVDYSSPLFEAVVYRLDTP
ncbi:hypothetical protein ACFLYO_05790, partial [Chloroflexota bacterium]